MTLGKCRVEKLEKRQYLRFLPEVQAPPGIIRLPACCRLCRSRHKRHTFAVRTLLGWYQHAQPIAPKLWTLATYLGHRHLADTYWYLSAVPELLQLGQARMATAQAWASGGRHYD